MKAARIAGYKYIICVAAFVFQIVAIELGLGASIVFPVSFCMLALLFFTTAKANPIAVRLIEMMIFTLPYAWSSILDARVEGFMLSWFYVFIFLFCISLFLGKKCAGERDKFGLLLAAVLIVCCAVVLLLSFNMSAVNEFVKYFVFLVLVMLCLLRRDKLSNGQITMLKADFIFVSLMIAAGLVAQFAIQKLFPTDFLHNLAWQSSAGIRTGYALNLYPDGSSNFMILCIAVVFLLFQQKPSATDYIKSLVLLGGLALTSTRTPLAALAAAYFVYILLLRSAELKFRRLLFYVFFALAALSVLSIVRPVSSILEYITDSSGRTELLLAALDSVWKHPLGIGLDLKAIFVNEGIDTVPHMWLVNIIVTLGIVPGLLFWGLIAFIAAQARGDTAFFWSLLTALIGSLFIPDLIGARFLFVLVPLILLQPRQAAVSADCSLSFVKKGRPIKV